MFKKKALQSENEVSVQEKKLSKKSEKLKIKKRKEETIELEDEVDEEMLLTNMKPTFWDVIAPEVGVITEKFED